MRGRQTSLIHFLKWLLAGVAGNFLLWLVFVVVATEANFAPPFFSGFIFGALTAIIVYYQHKWAGVAAFLFNAAIAFPLGLWATCYISERCL